MNVIATPFHMDAPEAATKATTEGVLPTILPATATDADIQRLKDRGVTAYREDDPPLLDLFI